MSAFRYLIFVAGVVLVAIVGMILNQFVSPMLDLASEQAASSYGQTGVGWMAEIWELVPVIAFALLVFGLLVGIIVRRQSVRGGI